MNFQPDKQCYDLGMQRIVLKNNNVIGRYLLKKRRH